MTDTIPEDVMKAAYQVIEFHRALDGSALKRGQGMATLIARAILAERERTAARLDHLESLFDAAGKNSPVYAAVERILDEKSAWIARPNPEVTSAIALTAVIAADLKSGASGTLAEMQIRLDRVESLLKRAGEALGPFAEFGENNTDDLGWTNNNCKNDRVCDWLGPTAFSDARTVANEVKEALNDRS